MLEEKPPGFLDPDIHFHNAEGYPMYWGDSPLRRHVHILMCGKGVPEHRYHGRSKFMQVSAIISTSFNKGELRSLSVHSMGLYRADGSVKSSMTL